jgi:hypothetical protein
MSRHPRLLLVFVLALETGSTKRSRRPRLLSAFVLILALAALPAWATDRATAHPGILDQAWSWFLALWSPDADGSENPAASVERPGVSPGGVLEHSFGSSGGGTFGDKGAGTDPNG